MPEVAGSSPVIHPNLAASASGTDVLEREDTDLSPQLDSQLASPWITIVWNDPVNLMTYVARVFRTYFGFDDAESQRLMLLVHNEGRAVVATGPREEMERHVEAMHGYGLWATLAQADA